MRKQMLATVCVALVMVAIPVIGVQNAHASIRPHDSVTYAGITFTRPAGDTCQGPIIGAYGSSALKTYITTLAPLYCQFEIGPGGPFAGNPAAAPDVVYASGGDSCPGDVYAGSDNTDPVLGLSDVFANACVVEGFSLGPNAITDNAAFVNLVQAVAPCPNANVPQGGTITAYAPSSQTPCSGGSLDPSVNPLGFCAPSNLSLAQANLLWNQKINNWSKIGGCNQPTTVDNRVAGSGTRVTWCFNIYSAGVDSCKNNGATTGPFGTTGAMLTGICGVAGTTPGADGLDSIGYASRSGTLISGQTGNPPNRTMTQCGIVALNGVSGWNGQCDPNNAASTGGSPSPLDGVSTCPGDIQVATDQYQAWGYEHLVVASAVNSTNQPAKDFVSWATNPANDPGVTIRSTGFMQSCQMGFKRSVDGGAPSVQTATC